MRLNDAEQLHKIYLSFIEGYVGPLARGLKVFKRITRRKTDLNWVALDEKGEIVGYVLSAYMKGRRSGRINEIIVDPNYDFETVAHPLVDKVSSILIEKGATIIQASSLRSPYYPQIFPKMGFFSMETAGVFMLAIDDTAKFLDEIKPIITRRLERLYNWDGCLEIKCGINSLYFTKQSNDVQSLIWTNQNTDLKILLEANTLSKILRGVVDAKDMWAEGNMKVETTLDRSKTKEVLDTIFPKKQFLALNFW